MMMTDYENVFHEQLTLVKRVQTLQASIETESTSYVLCSTHTATEQITRYINLIHTFTPCLLETFITLFFPNMPPSIKWSSLFTLLSVIFQQTVIPSTMRILWSSYSNFITSTTFYIRSTALYSAETWTLQKADQKVPGKV
jgi:hypothetical protein